MLLASAAAVMALGAPAAAAQGENLGGGVAVGTVAFETPVHLGGGCRSTGFTISGSSQTAVVNTVVTAYVGPVELRGSGHDACPSSLARTGAFELTATGEAANGSTLACDLEGTYTRLGTLASVTTSGTCIVNAFPAEVTFVAEVPVVPDQLSPMRSAQFVAPFTVSP